ncbi:Fasciclin-like arabinogalactan protein 10 [Platanthera zijinensis]|uniref:Fasciclin-like arabinogalactan protein 10 n=1 Tax=Platanthera zijinensis TaxID=2320716 RepID=A0AAP0BQ11_9ASPA
MAKRSLPHPLLFTAAAVAVASLCSPSKCHNITTILNNFPGYSMQNSLMSSTEVADEVNSRESLTCLVLLNSAMSALAANHTPSSLKNALRLLVLLDYFDPQKLHNIDGGTAITTTLYQTTGEAIGQQGFVNITDYRGGRVAFRSAVKGSKFASFYTKSVRQIPYTISVLEISAPIVFDGLLDGSPADANITAVLENAGCKTFASLISSTGMIKIFQAARAKGLTLFAPNDEAFKAKGAPDLNSLSSADLVALIQYHAVASYAPKDSLKTANRPIATMASGAAGNYEISVSSRGDDVTLLTGLDSSRIAGTALDETPVCILIIDRVLLPMELFGNAPATAPESGSADFSTPPTEAPAPASAYATSPTVAKVPAPVALSPPETPVPAPAAESPENVADKEDDISVATAVKLSFSSAMIVAAAAASWVLW